MGATESADIVPVPYEKVEMVTYELGTGGPVRELSDVEARWVEGALWVRYRDSHLRWVVMWINASHVITVTALERRQR